MTKVVWFMRRALATYSGASVQMTAGESRRTNCWMRASTSARGRQPLSALVTDSSNAGMRPGRSAAAACRSPGSGLSVCSLQRVKFRHDAKPARGQGQDLKRLHEELSTGGLGTRDESVRVERRAESGHERCSAHLQQLGVALVDGVEGAW